LLVDLDYRIRKSDHREYGGLELAAL